MFLIVQTHTRRPWFAAFSVGLLVGGVFATLFIA
jgi:hypothetical protein